MNTSLLKTISLVVFWAVSNSVWAQDKMLLRTPALSPDGNQIAFSYQGDIWTVATSGGKATRKTIHEGYESQPVWNAKGDQIAFAGSRYSNQDIFVIPAEGGLSKRLTFHSATDVPFSWTPAGEILFTSKRAYAQIEWESEVHAVAVQGGTPSRFFDALGDMPSMSPNGKLVAFVKGPCRTSREDYRGPANREIWIFNTESKAYHRITQFDGNDFMPVWGNDKTLYFISSKSGAYNVWQQNIDGSGKVSGKAKQLTKYTEMGMQYLSVGGQNIVFERLGELFTLSTNGGTPKKITIQLGADYRFDPKEHKTYRNNISGYDVSPNGKQVALVIRGEVFVKMNDKEQSRSVNISKHPYRDRQVTWLNDSTLIFVSDRDGQNELYLAKSSNPDESSLFKSLKVVLMKLTNTPEFEYNPLVSPDGSKITFQRGHSRGASQQIVADIDSTGKITNEKVLVDGWQTASGITWSPDSKWLAYSMSDLNFNSEVYIHAASGDQERVNVSMHPRGDYGPSWSPDGSKLAFISERNNSDQDIWFAWLKKEDWEKTQGEWQELAFEEKENKKAKKEAVSVQIDFEEIHYRLQQVTSLPGDESSPIFSKDGNTVFFSMQNNLSNNDDLFSAKWDGSEVKQITKGGTNPRGLQADSKSKNLYFVQRGSLKQLSMKGTKITSMPHVAKMVIDHQEEGKQIFEEGWMALQEGFYDPEFHGKNWESLKKTYRPIVLSASTKQDYQYMFNLMLGQLNASHMGLRGVRPQENTQRERTGRLGIELEADGAAVKVTKVVLNSPADKTKSKLAIGDKILSVNGINLTSSTNFYSLLTNSMDEINVLEVEAADGSKREVMIRPARSISRDLYNEWVTEKKKLVEKYSNGRLGYIHIQGMNWPSFERFERELMASGNGKEGLVIDVRYNGGGWTTDYMMAVLNVKQHAYTIPRGAVKNLDKEHKKYVNYYPYGERLPLAAWTKPSIAMCNEASYSNAEIFSHAYKNLGIGKLVGIPTFGAVISTGASFLMDGSLVRMPFRAWYVKATQENMELGPAVPDIILSNEPGSKATGEDTQLKRAVEELLKDLK
ncbi:MAG: S41 family peptidase [Flammeovirgaceae bacterium]